MGEKFPPLSTSLHLLSHPLLQKAQDLPEEASAKALQPILALKDRSWWKVKVNQYRGAATSIEELCSSDFYRVARETESYWWLCRAGVRQEDSASDFYKVITEQAARLVTQSDRVERQRKTDTSSWLPSDRDLKRLDAERATLFVSNIRETVRSLIARSMHDGRLWKSSAADQEIVALVRADDGEAYLAVGACGYYDEKVIAIILDSVPGIHPDDWMIEPSEVRGITPTPGQVVFSAVIPPSVQAEMLSIELPDDWADAESDDED